MVQVTDPIQYTIPDKKNDRTEKDTPSLSIGLKQQRA